MKRGRIGAVIAVILAAAMLSMFAFTACDDGLGGENSHEHSLTHVDARESTCTSEGNIEHWQCTSCGKYFKDAAATTEATWGELQLPMLEHDYDPATHCCKNCGSYDNEGAQTALRTKRRLYRLLLRLICDLGRDPRRDQRLACGWDKRGSF